MEHMPDVYNVVPCALSRPLDVMPGPAGAPIPVGGHLEAPLSFFREASTAVATCPPLRFFVWRWLLHMILVTLVKAMCRLTPLDVQEVPLHNMLLLCDMYSGQPRPLVPVTFSRAVFDMLHSACQTGVKATRRLILSCFDWPLLAKQVTMWARNCMPCHLAKTHKHVHLAPALFLCPAAGLVTFLWPWLPLCRFPKAAGTSSPLWTALLAGLKRF